MDTKLGIRNKFIFEKRNVITDETLESQTSHNIITNNGLDHLINHNRDFFKYMHFGTGAGVPTEENFSMFGWLTYKTVTKISFGYNYDLNCFEAKYKAVITENTHVGVTITEVGLSPSTVNGGLTTHSNDDKNGVPLAITIAENEEITIYAHVYVTTENGEFIWSKNNSFIRDMLWESYTYHKIWGISRGLVGSETFMDNSQNYSDGSSRYATISKDMVNKTFTMSYSFEPTIDVEFSYHGFLWGNGAKVGGHGLGSYNATTTGFSELPILNSNVVENIIPYEIEFLLDEVKTDFNLGANYQNMDFVRAKVYGVDSETETLMVEGTDYNWVNEWTGEARKNDSGTTSFKTTNFCAFEGREREFYYKQGWISVYSYYRYYNDSNYLGRYKKDKGLKESTVNKFYMGDVRDSGRREWFPLADHSDIEDIKDTKVYIFKDNDTYMKLLNKHESGDIWNIVPIPFDVATSYIYRAYINKDVGKVVVLTSSNTVIFYDYRFSASNSFEMAHIKTITDIQFSGMSIEDYGEKYATHLLCTGTNNNKMLEIDWINNEIIDKTLVSFATVDDLAVENICSVTGGDDWNKFYILGGVDRNSMILYVYSFDRVNMVLGERLNSYPLADFGLTDVGTDNLTEGVVKANYLGKAFTIYYNGTNKKFLWLADVGSGLETIENSTSVKGALEVGLTDLNIPFLRGSYDDCFFRIKVPRLVLTGTGLAGNKVKVKEIYQPDFFKHINNRIVVSLKIQYSINQA